MRDELKNFDWHVYGLKTTDFSVTLGLIDEIISNRDDQLQRQISETVVYDEKGEKLNNDHDGVNEVLDDLRYYKWIDDFFIYHFGLWRLQGIFEGMLRQEFFPDKELTGLKKKLDTVIEMGYLIDNKDYLEIIEWGRLRNALSHFPPEQYRPAGLTRDDLSDYQSLVDRTITNLIEQREKNNVR
jgi:uncharacterized protein YlaN (UPF0358 family)